ncbi:choice-of-anchor G family protein [Jannaschia sp. R86511]|uniref:choice-of-anchor G family protein n=1 Tax=Jannaschia sp. R86511 TaxID=3093853 RepID=UPI0036D20A54
MATVTRRARRDRRRGGPRAVLLVLLVCLGLLAPGTSLAARTSATHAAWTDTEWVHAGLTVRMPRDCATPGRYTAATDAALLRGQVGPTSLATVAGLSGLRVTRSGTGTTPAPATALPAGPDAFRDPLGAEAVAGLVAAELGGVVQLAAPAQAAGVLHQYGRATSAGQAHAAAGAVTDSGALLVGASQAGAATLPGPAALDLAALAPGTAALAGVRLRVGAVAAGARLDGCLRDEGGASAVREYGIASLRADVASPPVAALTQTTTAAVATAQGTVTALEQTLAAVLLRDLNLLGLGTVTTSATVTVDLQQAVAPLLQQTLTDGVVTVDLAAGRVQVDLAALPAGPGGLDGRSPGTVLALDAAAAAAVGARVDTLLRTWVGTVVQTVDTALRGAAVDIRASIKAPLLPALTVRVSGTLAQVVAGNATVSAVGLSLPPAVLATLGTAVSGALFTPPGGAVPVLRSTLLAAVPAVLTQVGAAVSALGTAVRLTVNVHTDDPVADTWAVTALRVQVLTGSNVGSRVDLATASVGPVRERP